MTKRAATITLVLWAAATAGCATTQTQGVRVATFSALTTPQASVDPRLIAEHCPFGAPRKLPSLEHGPTTILAREGYVLEHDAASKIALWVCESMDKDFWDPSRAARKNPFAPDPDLVGKPRAELADYRGSGFDRGHMAPSADRLRTQPLNDSTFFLSNMVPQNAPLNQTYWARLEALIRTWVQDGVVHNAKVLTGGFFYDPAEDNPATADGLVPFSQIGRGDVAVPTHIFKIVVGQNARNELQAIAFVVKNEKPPRNAKFEDAIVAIAWLEERAGLNFMPDLTPAQERALEATPSRMWKP
jgi:DNA/RNA endonuclease G (NUC1)